MLPPSRANDSTRVGSSQWGRVEQALILHVIVKNFSIKGSHSNGNLATCELTSEP